MNPRRLHSATMSSMLLAGTVWEGGGVSVTVVSLIGGDDSCLENSGTGILPVHAGVPARAGCPCHFLVYAADSLWRFIIGAAALFMASCAASSIAALIEPALAIFLPAMS